NAARAGGPALGAALLPALGPGMCFLVNALSFVAVLLALSAMDARAFTARPGGRPVQSLREGVHYLRARPWLLGLVLLSGAMALFGWPVLSLLPALSRHELGAGPEMYGVMVSAVGLGAMAAALLVASFGTARRRVPLLAAGVALETLGVVLLA